MTIDVARARAETPGVRNVVHFNNAGCALPPQSVVDAMVDHLKLEAAIGGYEAHDRRIEAIERPYHALSRLLNCAPDEIAIVENATRAWDMAFYAMPLGPGDRIVTAQSEYCSNFIAFLHVAQRTGAEIRVVPNDELGQISVDALRKAVDEHVKLIAITHVPTSGGLVNPAAEVGRIARSAGIPFLLDACQSVGQIPIDVEEVGCDMLSGTGRKFLRGPRGIGFLYVRRGLLDRLDSPFLDDHAATWCDDRQYEVRRDARKFETQECSFAARIGLGVAIDYALEWRVPAINARVIPLAERLRQKIAEIPGARIHDLGRERCGIVTFSSDFVGAEAIRESLLKRNINVTVATKEATRLDMAPRGLDEIVRASVHYYNTDEEVEKFVEILHQITAPHSAEMAQATT
jgi:cysteine desulfurase / selenocysteine lyase